MDSITQKDVIRIMELVEKTDTDELHLEMGDLKLTIRKGINVQTAPPAAEVETTSKVVERNELASSTEPDNADKGIVPAPGLLEDKTDGALTIRAPMLGTFYKAPKPGAPPFVEVGHVVDINDTVCIIEVMKLFSTIKAGVQGRIVKILANDGQMVEFNQPLFLLEAVTGQRSSGKRKAS